MEISAEKLLFSYEQTDGDHPALRDVSFTLHSGECVALVGPSGSGKSTLAQHLNGLLRPEAGSISTDGKPLSYSAAELRVLRRKVGLVFQFPEVQIFEQTVFDEVAFAARQWGIPQEEIPVRVTRALQIVGLNSESLWARNPFKLSGGEARLISIASFLIVDPEWLILDEPTLGLDIVHWRCVQALIRHRRERTRGVLLITHDLNLAFSVCPRIMVLNQGTLHYDGPAEDLFLDHDLSVEYDLVDPEIIRVWKLLKSGIPATSKEINSFPEPDPEILKAWVTNLPSAHRDRVRRLLRDDVARIRCINEDLRT